MFIELKKQARVEFIERSSATVSKDVFCPKWAYSAKTLDQ